MAGGWAQYRVAERLSQGHCRLAGAYQVNLWSHASEVHPRVFNCRCLINNRSGCFGTPARGCPEHKVRPIVVVTKPEPVACARFVDES